MNILSALLGPSDTLEADPRGFEALALFSGAAHAFLAPAYVFLTHAWYTRSSEQIIRTIIWAGSRLIFDGLYMQIEAVASWSDNVLKYLKAGWAGLCILLGAYAFFMLGTPDQVRWGSRVASPETQARLKTSRTWESSSVSRHSRRLCLDLMLKLPRQQILKALQNSETFIFACLAFLLAISSYEFSLNVDRNPYFEFAFRAILPFLCIMVLAYLLACFFISRGTFPFAMADDIC